MDYAEQWREILMFELRTREERGELPALLDSFSDPWFEKKYPAVGLVLFANATASGKVRKTGSFAAWRSPEGITVKISDNELGETYQYTAESFERALARVEKALQEGVRGNKPSAEKKPRQRRK
jgi:hypothetical protein